MAAHPDRARGKRGHIRQIITGRPLARNSILKAKVEILLPANQSSVGTAENDKDISGAEKKSDGGELHFKVRRFDIPVSSQTQAGEAAALCHFLKQTLVFQ